MGKGSGGRDKQQGEPRMRSAKAARKAHANGGGWGKKCSENWKIYLIIGIFCSGGFSFVWMIVSNLFPAYSYLSIDIDGGAAMQATTDALVGGKPWLILCNNGSTPIHSVFARAAQLGMQSGAFSSGVLNCFTPLPSGRTVLERFKLTKAAKGIPDGRIALVAGNGNRPRMLPATFLGHNGKGEVAEGEPSDVYAYVVKQTQLQIGAVSSTDQLHKSCFGKRKACVMLIQNGTAKSAPEAERQHLSMLMEEHRGIRFVRVNAYKWAVSIEKHLKPLERSGFSLWGEDESNTRMLYWGQLLSTREHAKEDLSADKGAKRKKKGKRASFGVKVLKSPFTYENANNFLKEIIYNHRKQVQFMNSKISNNVYVDPEYKLAKVHKLPTLMRRQVFRRKMKKQAKKAKKKRKGQIVEEDEQEDEQEDEGEGEGREGTGVAKAKAERKKARKKKKEEKRKAKQRMEQIRRSNRRENAKKKRERERGTGTGSGNENNLDGKDRKEKKHTSKKKRETQQEKEIRRRQEMAKAEEQNWAQAADEYDEEETEEDVLNDVFDDGNGDRGDEAEEFQWENEDEVEEVQWENEDEEEIDLDAGVDLEDDSGEL